MLQQNNIIAFVPVAAAPEARAFYQTVLGLPVVSEDDFAIVLNANGIMLRLVKMRDFTPAKFTVLGWQVANLESAVSELEHKGVHFEHYGMKDQDDRGIWRSPSGAQIAWFKDPSGNVLSLTQF